MAAIHPTAVIDTRAELGAGVEIGPHAVVQGPVHLGAGCVLHAHATVLGDTHLGAGNVVFPGAVIGAAPQDLKYGGEDVRLRIGERNQFREHVTVHAGTAQDGGLTEIGSDGLFMVGSHVAHDCRVGDRVILANHVLLAGHIAVQDGAILNGASACHHFTTIGRYAYVGGLTRITQDVYPFTVVEGHPARIRACNVIGLARAGVGDEDVQLVRRAIKDAFISDRMSVAEALEAAEARSPGHPLIGELVAAVRASEQGRQGRAREPRRGASGSA